MISSRTQVDSQGNGCICTNQKLLTLLPPSPARADSLFLVFQAFSALKKKRIRGPPTGFCIHCSLAKCSRHGVVVRLHLQPESRTRKHIRPCWTLSDVLNRSLPKRSRTRNLTTPLKRREK